MKIDGGIRHATTDSHSIENDDLMIHRIDSYRIATSVNQPSPRSWSWNRPITFISMECCQTHDHHIVCSLNSE